MTTENERALEETSDGVTALLDAAARVARIADRGTFNHDPDGSIVALSQCDVAALRLLAKYARESATQAAELDAWRRLAKARPERDYVGVYGAVEASQTACAALRDIGVNPTTGERVATEDPR